MYWGDDTKGPKLRTHLSFFNLRHKDWGRDPVPLKNHTKVLSNPLERKREGIPTEINTRITSLIGGKDPGERVR